MGFILQGLGFRGFDSLGFGLLLLRVEGSGVSLPSTRQTTCLTVTLPKLLP